jgi:hypothetical protein
MVEKQFELRNKVTSILFFIVFIIIPILTVEIYQYSSESDKNKRKCDINKYKIESGCIKYLIEHPLSDSVPKTVLLLFEEGHIDKELLCPLNGSYLLHIDKGEAKPSCEIHDNEAIFASKLRESFFHYLIFILLIVGIFFAFIFDKKKVGMLLTGILVFMICRMSFSLLQTNWNHLTCMNNMIEVKNAESKRQKTEKEVSIYVDVEWLLRRQGYLAKTVKCPNGGKYRLMKKNKDSELECACSKHGVFSANDR